MPQHSHLDKERCPRASGGRIQALTLGASCGVRRIRADATAAAGEATGLYATQVQAAARSCGAGAASA
jgi:hypothetical protein